MSVHIRIRNGLAPDGSGVGGASEGDIRGDLADMIEQTGGVVDLAGGGVLVHEASPLARTVVVDAGVAYVPNTSFDETDSDSIKFWEAVIAGTTGARTLSISANSSGQTRNDIICVMVDTGATPDNTASNVGSLIVVDGIPGAGVPATPSNYLKIAEVEVVNGAATIADEKITDTRVQLTIKDAFTPASSSAIQTLSNKRITKRIGTTASSTTPTPDADLYDQYNITALAAGATFGAPTGTPTHGQSLVIRIKDNGTARSLAFNAIYRFSTEMTAPTTTIINKTLYLGFIYNTTDTKWDCVAILNNI